MDNKTKSTALATYIKANRMHHKYSTLAHVIGMTPTLFSNIINGKTKTTFDFKQVLTLTAYLKPHGYRPPAAHKELIGEAITEPESITHTPEGEAPATERIFLT